MKTIFVIKGISGSGKSSRVKVLIDYLSLFLTVEDYFVNNKRVGFYFKEIDFIIIGRAYNKMRVEKIQGIDNENKKFGSKISDFTDWLHTIDNNILIEGSAIMLSNRFRPTFLKEVGFEKQLYFYYHFAEKEEYQERVRLRSNLEIKDTMWNNQRSFLLDNEKSLVESEQFQDKCIVNIKDYDAPIYDIGIGVLQHFNLPIEDFIDYCNIVKYEHENVFKNWK